MAASAQVATPYRFSLPDVPASMRAPLTGTAWVLLNIALGWAGQASGHLTFCSIVIGAVDGAVISMVVVGAASHRLQASLAGVLSGIGIHNFSGGGESMVTQAAQRIHAMVDVVLDSTSGDARCEQLHKAVELAAIQGAWIAIFVILAALLAAWREASQTPTSKTQTRSFEPRSTA